MITCAFRFNIHYLFVYLFKAMSTKAGGTDHLFFIYLCKWLVVRDGFHFNIQYLFIYLFKGMSTKARGSDHLFLFTYAKSLLIHKVIFILIFSIYFFIYSKRCQQKQVELTTFITPCNEVGARLCFYMCLWFCPQLVAGHWNMKYIWLASGQYASYWNAFLFTYPNWVLWFIFRNPYLEI